VARATQQGVSKSIDILSNGFVVAPPSRHRRGFNYRWDVRLQGELPFPPHWARTMMPDPPWLRRGAGTMFKCRPQDQQPVREATLEEALYFLEPEDYDMWLRVGFALKVWENDSYASGRGLALWDRWSQGSTKYPGYKALSAKWHSFRRDRGVTVGSLFKHAKDGGWSGFGGDDQEFSVASPWKRWGKGT